jgi:hypothetical protein
MAKSTNRTLLERLVNDPDALKDFSERPRQILEEAAISGTDADSFLRIDSARIELEVSAIESDVRLAAPRTGIMNPEPAK